MRADFGSSEGVCRDIKSHFSLKLSQMLVCCNHPGGKGMLDSFED